MANDRDVLSLADADHTERVGVGTRVVRGVGVGVLRTVIGQSIGAVAVVLLSNRLQASAFFVYGALNLFGVATYALITGSIASPMTRHAGVLRRVDIDAAYWSLTLVFGAAALVALTVGVVTGAVSVGVGVAVYLAAVPLRFPAFVVLRRRLAVGRLAIIELVDRLVFHGVTVAWVLGGSGGEAAAIGIAAAAVASAIAAQAVSPWLPRRANLRLVRPWLRESAAFQWSSVVLVFAEAAAVPAVRIATGATQAGLFSWAYSIAAVPLAVVFVAMAVLFPAFARLSPSERTESAAVSTRLLTVTVVGMAAGIAALAPALVGTLFAARWHAALPTLWLLLAGIVAIGSTAAINSLFTASGLIGRLAVWQTFALLASFGVGTPLALAFGAVGFAAAQSAAQIALAVLLALWATRNRGVPLAPEMIRTFAAGLLAAALGLAVGRGANGPLGVTLVGITVVASYPLLVVMLSRGRVLHDVRLALRLVRAKSKPAGADTSVVPGG